MGRLFGQIAYLSGAMDRVHDRGIVWRDEITPRLRDMNIGILNPLDKPMLEEVSEDENFLAKRDALFDNIVNNDTLENRYAFADFMKMHVVRPDLGMVDYAHFLIVYIDMDIHLAGTYRELVQAFLQRKPCLIVCKQGVAHVAKWWWGELDPAFFFNNFDEMFEYLEEIDRTTDQRKFWRFFDLEKVYGKKIKFVDPD